MSMQFFLLLPICSLSTQPDFRMLTSVQENKARRIKMSLTKSAGQANKRAVEGLEVDSTKD